MINGTKKKLAFQYIGGYVTINADLTISSLPVLRNQHWQGFSNHNTKPPCLK